MSEFKKPQSPSAKASFNTELLPHYDIGVPQQCKSTRIQNPGCRILIKMQITITNTIDTEEVVKEAEESTITNDTTPNLFDSKASDTSPPTLCEHFDSRPMTASYSEIKITDQGFDNVKVKPADQQRQDHWGTVHLDDREYIMVPRDVWDGISGPPSNQALEDSVEPSSWP